MTESKLDLGKQLKSKIETLHVTLSVLDTLERGDPSKSYVVSY